ASGAAVRRGGSLEFAGPSRKLLPPQVGKRSFYPDRLVANGVEESQTASMKGNDAFARHLHRRTKGQRRAVEYVPANGPAARRCLDADLMHASGLRLDFQKRTRSFRTEPTIAEDRMTRAW